MYAWVGSGGRRPQDNIQKRLSADARKKEVGRRPEATQACQARPSASLRQGVACETEASPRSSDRLTLAGWRAQQAECLAKSVVGRGPGRRAGRGMARSVGERGGWRGCAMTTPRQATRPGFVGGGSFCCTSRSCWPGWPRVMKCRVQTTAGHRASLLCSKPRQDTMQGSQDRLDGTHFFPQTSARGPKQGEEQAEQA